MIQERPKALKYWTLVEHLREQVVRNILQPGDRVPSLVEMQEQFGVSRGTVEKAYTLLEQEGLLIKTQGSGTFVMTPPSKPQHVVALLPQLMPNDQDLYWFALLKGITESAQKNRVEIIYSYYDDNNSIWERADGMIITGGSLENFGNYPPNFPFVSLVSVVQGASSVIADDYAGMYNLTEHLLKLGHRHIAMLFAFKPGSVVTSARYDGHRAALKEYGVDYLEENTRIQEPIAREVALKRDALEVAHVEAGYEGMKKWLVEGFLQTGCTAIMAYNDAMAIGIMRALREAGLSVPEDVSVTGFDGTPSFDYVTPKLTTAYVPLYDIGSTGLDLLYRRMQGEKDVPARVQLPTSIIQGDSTAMV